MVAIRFRYCRYCRCALFSIALRQLDSAPTMFAVSSVIAANQLYDIDFTARQSHGSGDE